MLNIRLAYISTYANVIKLFDTTGRLMLIGVAGDRIPLWRHQMETFSALLALCAGNSPVAGEFPAQRPVMRGFDVFFHLRLNEQLSKQS